MFAMVRVLLSTCIVQIFLATASSTEEGNGSVSDQPVSFLDSGSSLAGNSSISAIYSEDLGVSGVFSVAMEASQQMRSLNRTARKAILRQDFLWPEDIRTGKPTFIYEIVGSADFQKIVKESMLEVEEHTCIDFRLADVVRDKSYIMFVQHPDICGSLFGRREGPMKVDISARCTNKYYILQLLVLALGFIPQISRDDRDDFILVNKANVVENLIGSVEIQITSRLLTSSTAGPYDYTSVAHPDGLYGSKNGLLTLITKDVRHQGLLGRSNELSHMDKRLANFLYKCPSKWMIPCGHNHDPCENFGYVGASCYCICPPGTTGDRCQHQVHDYYKESLPACSRDILKETVIKSPEFPSKIKKNTWCVFSIKAPYNHVVKLKFKDFHLEKTTNTCSAAFLEIRYQYKYFGPTFCEKDIKPGQEFLSNGTTMDLYLDVRNDGSQGFEANVTFIYIGPPTEPPPSTADITLPSFYMNFIPILLGYLSLLRIVYLT